MDGSGSFFENNITLYNIKIILYYLIYNVITNDVTQRF